MVAGELEDDDDAMMVMVKARVNRNGSGRALEYQGVAGFGNGFFQREKLEVEEEVKWKSFFHLFISLELQQDGRLRLNRMPNFCSIEFICDPFEF